MEAAEAEAEFEFSQLSLTSSSQHSTAKKKKKKRKQQQQKNNTEPLSLRLISNTASLPSQKYVESEFPWKIVWKPRLGRCAISTRYRFRECFMYYCFCLYLFFGL